MRPRFRRLVSSVAPFVLFAACHPTLTKDIIRNHPAVNLKVLRPEVVESSAPIEPVWVRKSERGSGDALPFSGQSFAKTLDTAKAQAERDLLSAVSNYVAVEVESEFESVETHASNAQGTKEEQSARNVVRTHSASAIRGLKPDDAYWEKVVASPLTPENVSYRYYVHAFVPRSEILRARLKKLIARSEATAKKTVVLLPFSATIDAQKSDVLANAFVDELAHRLADDANLQITDPTIVLTVVGDGAGKTETEALEAVEDALLPDLVVRGGYQRVDNRIKVTYLVYDTKEARPVKTRSMDATYDKLFSLEDSLVDALRKDLDEAAAVEPKSTRGQKDRPTSEKALAAFEAYHAAYARFRAGDNAGALTQIERAISLRPDDAEAYERLGHILERLGRYGNFRSGGSTYARSNRVPTPDFACLDQTRMAAFAAAATDASSTSKDDAWRENATDLDQLLDDIVHPLLMIQQRDPNASAADAYYRAIQIARKAGDWRLDAHVSLALADLARRVDRGEKALSIYSALVAYADRTHDLDLRSLARFGQGAALHALGRTSDATTLLRDALVDRIVLGEKPYLVEIYNELGAIAVETSHFAEARALYAKARRIAKDLGSDYITAVLTNNIGVLDYHLGRVATASDEFERAWDYLHQLGEAEGQISSGLNVGHVGAYLGDFDRAKEALDEVTRLIASTRQESRKAELLDHRAFLAAATGADPIPDLAQSWALYTRLGRTKQAQRLKNNIAVAEYRRALATDDPDLLRCVRGEMSQLVIGQRAGGDVLSQVMQLNAATLGALAR